MPTILIVDDANFIRTMLKRGLEKVGFQIFEAPTGVEAEDLMKGRKGQIDLIICDISMPGQDGITTLRNFKTIDEEIPVIMLTAFSDKTNVIQCANIGIAGFLAKPFDIKKVRAKICEVLDLELGETGVKSKSSKSEDSTGEKDSDTKDMLTEQDTNSDNS